MLSRHWPTRVRLATAAAAIGLFPSRLARLSPGLLHSRGLSRRGNSEVLTILAGLEGCAQPSGLQATPGPRFGRIVRVAVFGSDGAAHPAAMPLRTRSARPIAREHTELCLEGPALVDNLRFEGSVDLVPEFGELLDRHRSEVSNGSHVASSFCKSLVEL